MPTHTWRVGDLVSHVYGGNGTGEGILWRVTKVMQPQRLKLKIIPTKAPSTGTKLRIEPCFTLTGQSVRKPMVVSAYYVEYLSTIDLGLLRMQFDQLITRYIGHEAGIPEDSEPPSNSVVQ